MQLADYVSPRSLSCHSLSWPFIQYRIHQCQRRFGPSSYDVLASELHPLNPGNIIVKYADDTYPIVPFSHRDTVPLELNKISTWANKNKLKLNAKKSREMLIHRRPSFEVPSPIDGVTRVDEMSMLGFTMSDDLGPKRYPP